MSASQINKPPTNFLELAKTRRSIRRYKPDPIPNLLLNDILESARSAPSAGNLQAWKGYICTDKNTLKRLAEASFGQSFIREAKLAIVMCAAPRISSTKYGTRGKLYALLDAAIATTHILLAVHEKGLGTVWVGAFHDDSVRDVVGASIEEIPLAILPIGYPAESPIPPRRKSITELFTEVNNVQKQS